MPLAIDKDVTMRLRMGLRRSLVASRGLRMDHCHGLKAPPESQPKGSHKHPHLNARVSAGSHRAADDAINVDDELGEASHAGDKAATVDKLGDHRHHTVDVFASEVIAIAIAKATAKAMAMATATAKAMVATISIDVASSASTIVVEAPA